MGKTNKKPASVCGGRPRRVSTRKGMNMAKNEKSEKKKTEKPATEKKVRKARAKMRSRKDSFAGHFADKLASNVKSINDVAKAIKGVVGVDVDRLMGAATLVMERATELNTLAEAGFTPVAKKRGRQAQPIVAGQRVYLAPEMINQFKRDYPSIETCAVFVSDSYNAESDGNAAFLRMNGSDTQSPPLGRVSRKLFTVNAPAESVANA